MKIVQHCTSMHKPTTCYKHQSLETVQKIYRTNPYQSHQLLHDKAHCDFFEQALHAHQINKAIHPETGKLCEHPALLQSSDRHHWQESTCEAIGRLAQRYPPAVPEGTNTIFS